MNADSDAAQNLTDHKSEIAVIIKRFANLFLGVTLNAVGAVMTIRANIGLGPWDVLHDGVSKTTGITFGQACIIIGLLLVVFEYLVGEQIGFGTIINMIVTGFVIDLLLWSNIIPTLHTVIGGIALQLCGLFVIAVSTALYIGAGMGAGPRDALMVVLKKKTPMSIGLSRTIVELTVFIIGWMLGGSVGIGTIICPFSIGIIIQVTFHFMHFDTTKIKHQTMPETFRSVKQAIIGAGV